MRSTSDVAGGGGGDEREELSTISPFVAARRVLVATCWLVTTGAAFVPTLRFLAPWTVLALPVTVFGGVAEIRTAFAFKEPPSHARLHILISRTVLVLLAGCSIAGTITSVVPSMASRSEDGDILYEYGISSIVAPMLWGAIFSTSIGAIMIPSPRRLVLAAGAGLVGWPLFLVIRFLREPFMDLENRFLLLAPWILRLYTVAAFVASGLAVVLAFGAARLAEPVMRMPPNASVVSRADRALRIA